MGRPPFRSTTVSRAALIVREQGDHRILGDRPHTDLVWLMQEVLAADNENDQEVYAQTRTDDSAFPHQRGLPAHTWR